ncbi:hypothetical protein L249_2637 [Ophiocordyceps polyrhachis-furcata BCC 54312]|uniref:Uncharacterized protein n=1 Tax=Ophiocordyceps polyrhachis-furcata BCC 54312 TaxID=1330021 RepID=A0A367LPF3_9HYPO|nr:hypothetical protein L249_2637 [Ophiocordyceps polyrhachis-furcata BCC 54312]
MPLFTIRYPPVNESKVLDFIWIGLLSVEVLLVVGVALQAIFHQIPRAPTTSYELRSTAIDIVNQLGRGERNDDSSGLGHHTHTMSMRKDDIFILTILDAKEGHIYPHGAPPDRLARNGQRVNTPADTYYNSFYLLLVHRPVVCRCRYGCAAQTYRRCTGVGRTSKSALPTTAESASQPINKRARHDTLTKDKDR